MNKTLLEMTNSVLRAMREDQVSTINETEYSRMVSELIRDAYKFVEDAFNWAGLRSDVLVDTVAGTQEYTLTGVTSDSDILWSAVDSNFLQAETTWYLIKQEGNLEDARPSNYVVTGLDSTTGDLKVKFFPTPDDAYTVNFRVVKRGQVPEVDGDRIVVPNDPVRHMALALLTRERGETGGTSAAEYTTLYNRSLGDAMARESKLFMNNYADFK